MYSASNRSDGPSRNRPVASPTKEVPLWFSDLAAGKTYRFDIMLAAARVPRLPGRWLRLLLLLAGDVERNPGPVTFRAPCGALDLSSGFATTTKQKMTKSLDSGWEARCSFPFLLYSPMLKVPPWRLGHTVFICIPRGFPGTFLSMPSLPCKIAAGSSRAILHPHGRLTKSGSWPNLANVAP